MKPSAKAPVDMIAAPSPQQAFGLAQRAISEKNWPEASLCWAILRRAYPDHATPWIQGAVAEIHSGDLERAEWLLAHARQHFSNNPSGLLQSANVAMLREDWSTAENFLEQARERYPANAQTWLSSARCAEGRGDMGQALAYNREARERSPEMPAPIIQHAELAMRAEQWELALSRWEELRQRFPDNPAGYLRAAEAARRLNRPREARQLLLVLQHGSEILDDVGQPESGVERRGLLARMSRLLELVWTKAIFNLRSEVHHNYLSYAWWVLEPLLHMVVYYLVFGLLLQRGGENYPVFLLTGLIPWMWFNKAVSSGSGSIIGGQQLMLTVGLPPAVFPMVSFLQTSIKQLPTFVLLIGFIWLQGYSPAAQWWALFPVIIVQVLLTIAMGFAVASIIPFMRDLSYLVPTGLMLLMFCSGIFYDYRAISEQWQSLFLLNPMAFLLKSYREIFISGTTPDMSTLGWWGMGSAAFCGIMGLVFARLRYTYPRILMN